MLLDTQQSLYLLSILPILFGATLVGDGISKVLHETKGGLISLTAGFTFLSAITLVWVLR